MWRFLNSIPRAFRQHVHTPRPSAGVCVDEEKTDYDISEADETQGPFASRRKSLEFEADQQQRCCSCKVNVLNSTFTENKKNGWLGDKASGTGKEEGREWWRSCHYDFWKLLEGSHRMFEAISMGSAMLWGSDGDRQKRKTRLLYRVLFAMPGGATTVRGIKGQVETSSSVFLPAGPRDPGPMAIKDAEGAAHDAAVNVSKAESLDSAMEEFQSMCTEYTARSQSLLGLQAASQGDMTTAVQHLHSSCVLGNSSACFNLGLCYETGSGVTQDLDKAEYYYKKAAESGHSLALYNLGLMYLSDRGEVGDSEGTGVGAGVCCSGRREGLDMLEKAARLGLAEAQTYLGIHHMEETEDVSKALPYFRAAAEQNDSEAQYFLAMCHEQGWGVEVNECRAAQLYSLAAAAGHDMAMYNLGVFNEEGLGGLPEDLASAKDLYKRAAKLGNVQAEQRLEEISSMEKVDPWQEKLSTFQNLYQLYHKGEESSLQDHHHGSSSGLLSPSASSPNLSDSLHHNSLGYFFGTLDHGKTWKDQNHKVSFDPGGGSTSHKIMFQLGGDCCDGDDETISDRSIADDSFESGSGDEAPFHVATFHRSHTTPNLDMVACNV